MEVAVKQPPAAAQQRFVIDDPSKVGEARRAAQALASFEFSAEVAGKVAIVATELATNILRHAGTGELLVQALAAEDGALIELLALDKGPGMADIAACLRDGYSTGGTSGTGLGAVRRLASEFDIHSQPGEGTVVMARFGAKPPLEYGAINVALEGEIDCGDGWAVEQSEGVSAVMIADGLGHGTFAAEAARVAITSFRGDPFAPPQEILTRTNGLMSKTRGGAVACARLEDGKLSYAGFGNVAGVVLTQDSSQGLVSHNGTLGMSQRRQQQFEYRYSPGSLLVMHSDGISARWELKKRPDLLRCHAAIIAAAIYRDHARGTDDSTIVVLRP